MPRVSLNRRLELLAIGSAAGVFSGLFGVGGGTVMVPLLVLWLGYDERTATGTSLAAIIVISAVGAATLQDRAHEAAIDQHGGPGDVARRR